jgi:hypothetical protein
MEFHKPKPIHDWRELLTEIGVIVIGVAIALAAEQGVEWLHWRQQVSDAKEVIATELRFSVVGGINRVRAELCTERRLDQLAQIVEEGAKKGSLPPLGDILLPPRNGWPTGAWDSVVASQTATHFPRQQLADIAGAYKLIQRLEAYGTPEIETWSKLSTMTGPGRRLDPASESELRKALSYARTLNRFYASLGLQLANRVSNLHLPFSKDDLNRIAEASHPAASAPLPSICQPIGPAAAMYGQASAISATMSNGVRVEWNGANTDDAVKAIPDFSQDAP